MSEEIKDIQIQRLLLLLELILDKHRDVLSEFGLFEIEGALKKHGVTK